MEKIENHVSWEATIAIWWGIAWLFVGPPIAAGVFEGFFGPFPSVDKLLDDNPRFAILLEQGIIWAIAIWAIRASLRDKYAGFVFSAESKWTKQSLLTMGNRLPLDVVITVWWALTWRVAIVPVAILSGLMGAAVVSHRPIDAILAVFDSTVGNRLIMAISVPISIWAVREALAERYRSFRFATQLKMLPV